MASNKTYVSKVNNPIMYLMRKKGYKPNDLCRLLQITRLTLTNWQNDPERITVRNLIFLAGAFGIPAEVLLYMILRKRNNLKNADKLLLADGYYMEGDL